MWNHKIFLNELYTLLTLNKLAFSSEVSVKLANINRLTNSYSEREKQYNYMTFLH